MSNWAESELMSQRNPTRVQQALEWLQSGEPSSVERAITILQQTVFALGMKVCGNPADAEDTAQETLVRLARSLKNFPNTRVLSVWLYKVAKSQCEPAKEQIRPRTYALTRSTNAAAWS